MGGFSERRAMTEIRIKSTPWPDKAFTATVIPVSPLFGINWLQETHTRLCEADELRQQGKFDRAQKICESLVREHPGYVAAHHTLGLIHAAKKNHDRAFDHLSRAVMLNPRSWKALTALAGVCLDLRASDMAALALEQARAIKPRDANVLATLAEVYCEERDFEHAKEALRETVALDDNLFIAILRLGYVYEQLGQNAEAVQVYESLIKRGKCTLEALFALTSVPAAFVNVDLLAELDKLSRNQTDEPRFEEFTAIVRATGLDKAGRHAE